VETTPFQPPNSLWSTAACTEFLKIVLWVTKYPNEHTNLRKMPMAPSHPLTGGSNPYKKGISDCYENLVTGAIKYADCSKNKKKIIFALVQPLTGGRNPQNSIF